MSDPFERILVTLDGSGLAEVSLPVAEAFAREANLHITLLHVVESNAPATIHGEKHIQSRDEAERYLADVATNLRDSGLSVDAVIGAAEPGGVASVIAQTANEIGADLVVLATHGHGGFRNILFGRVAQNVLRSVSTPLIIVPARGEPESFECRSLAVLLSGDEESESVLPYARSLARFFADARVVLVRVVPTPGTLKGSEAAVGTLLPSATSKMLQFEESEAGDYLKRIAEDWFSGANVSIDVRRGEVESEIVEALRQHRADLALMSTHARTGFEAFLEGSTGQAMLERAVCPILLIRAEG